MLAAISSRPGQCGRADGYILEVSQDCSLNRFYSESDDHIKIAAILIENEISFLVSDQLKLLFF